MRMCQVFLNAVHLVGYTCFSVLFSVRALTAVECLNSESSLLENISRISRVFFEKNLPFQISSRRGDEC